MARGDTFTKEEMLRLFGETPQATEAAPTLVDTPLTEADIQTPTEESVQDDQSIIEGFATGVGKSAAQTVLGVGTLGRGIQSGVSGLGEALFGTASPFQLGEAGVLDKGTEERKEVVEMLTPEGRAEKFGAFVGDVAQFAIPSSYASKATLGASLSRRMLAQGLVGSSVQAAKTGDIGKDELAVGALNALTVPVGDAITKGISSLANHFPEWLVRPLVKQSPSAKLKGKDAAKYLVESGRIGSVDSLIKQSDDAMSVLNTQIDDIISAKASAGITVNRNELIAGLVDDINQAGGAGTIDDVGVMNAINRLAPQAKGLLQKDTLTIAEANQLRKLLDQTLGDRAFLSTKLTFNKSILMDFTNALRESVKNSDDALRPLYSEYAKNITLKQALNARSVAGGGANSVGMYDLLTGGGVFTATGDPVTSLMAVAGRRAFETAPVKTGLAQVFKNTDKVLPALEAAAPAVRGAVMSFIASLTEGKQDKRQQ